MKSYQLNALYLAVIAACYIYHTEAVTSCNPWYGPAGFTHCVKLSGYYGGYQWATCRTDTYIRTKSKGNHRCRDRSITYCYYQCMVDVYNTNSGFVRSHCQCSPYIPAPTESVPLPAWCYSPDGSSCNWYRECLNKAYPSCENDDDDYAIKFAEKFCKLYNESYSKFSPYGRKWVNAVRKCLQLKLVPLVDKTRVKTCKDLKSTSFDSHTPCYLNPDESSLTYCDLSDEDKNTVFWTIKSSISKAFWPSLKGFLDVREKCSNKENTKSQEIKAKIQDEVDKIIPSKNKTKSALQEMNVRIKVWLQNATSPIELAMFIRNKDWKKADDDERSQFAGKVADAVASDQKWHDKGVAWFAYAEERRNIVSIRLLITDRFKYEETDNSTSPVKQPANFTKILMKLGKDVYNGTLNLQIDGDVEIVKLNGCLDWNCEEHAFNATSLKWQESEENEEDNESKGKKKSKESNGAVMYGAMSLLTYFGLLMINSLFSIS